MRSILRTKLTVLLVVALLIAAPGLVDVAHGQRSGDRTSPDSVDANREGNNAPQGGFRGRRGGRGERGERSQDQLGDQAARRSSRSDSPVDSAAASSSGVSDTERIRQWARKLIQDNDKNGNMMLEAAEQGGLGSSSRGADLNSDGVITLDELITHVSPKPAGATTPASSRAAQASSSRFGTASRSPEAPDSAASRDEQKETETSSVGRTRSDTRKTGNPQKSYRFTPPSERLPAGLPGWFKSRDSDGDGQVAMHEYSRSWSERTAAEFVRYDKDNDGMITPAEARRQ
jgi:hypothetical protein